MYYRSGTGVRCWIGARLSFQFTHQVAALLLRKITSCRHLECVTSNRKSDFVDRRLFTWGTILPNYFPIRFETTEPWAFWI